MLIIYLRYLSIYYCTRVEWKFRKRRAPRAPENKKKSVKMERSFNREHSK